MKSLEAYIFKNGFTLVELMMVMGILALLIVVSLPLAINFYKTRTLDVHESGIVQVLRRAQLKAMSVEANSSFGVHISQGQYVLFKGDFYSPGDPYNEVFDLPDNLQVSGPADIIFNKLNGTTSSGTITLTLNSRSETININEMGRVNY